VGILSGAMFGYRSAQQVKLQRQIEQSAQALKEQFDLGIQEMAAGRYDFARQRFQYVFNQDPNFPGLSDKLASVLTILYATATPLPATSTASPSPTITVTPTQDLRPIEERFSQAQDSLSQSEWSKAIDVLLNLRRDEPTYRATRVDGMLYIALRQSGVDKIYKEGDLEGGMYDLTLAENFGPLDLEAAAARNAARLYLYGSSFWEAYPELAVYYFGLAASTAPYLHDASGWTASARYRDALVQLGDKLASGEDWCGAYQQYILAEQIRGDAALSKKMDDAYQRCNPPTGTPAATISLTPTPSQTAGVTISPTLTAPVVTTISPPPTDTETPVPPTIEPPSATPTDTPPPPPEDTPTPTETPLSSNYFRGNNHRVTEFTEF
jgi:hypothetical protein